MAAFTAALADPSWWKLQECQAAAGLAEPCPVADANELLSGDSAPVRGASARVVLEIR